MAVLTDAWRKQYEADFASMIINPGKLKEGLDVAAKIEANRARYETISKATNGIPWYFIGALHYREASLDFTKFLGDGEPLDRASVNVPAHMGPWHGPDAFEQGAIAALKHEGFDKVTDWSLGSILFHAEEYNGEGYHLHHLPSPYVFAGSDKYSHGMYLSDGKFSYSAVDPRIGVAVIIASLIVHHAITLETQGTIKMSTAAPTPAPASAPSTSWLSSVFSDVVSAAKTNFTTVWTAISGMIGSASAGASIIGILMHINPSWTAIAVGVLGIAGTILGVVASAYHLITHVSATNNATIALAEKWFNTAEGWAGQPQIDFSAYNGTVAPAAAPAQAAQ
jgi:lysozyme family protein